MNPLEGYSCAIEALMDLCVSGRDETRLEAARELLQHTSVPPTVSWDFELIEEEE